MNLKRLDELRKELAHGSDITSLSQLSELRMLHLIDILKELDEKCIPGDIIETGCWRGGACIFMRAILDELGNKDRKIYAADSFEGMPVPNIDAYPVDSYSDHHKIEWLKAPIDSVKANFKKYGYLDDRTIFVPGWFKDTLPTLKPASGRWALLRLDGDLYESTIQALSALYADLSFGGYVVVDDFKSDIGAKTATLDFLGKFEETEVTTLCLSAYWKK